MKFVDMYEKIVLEAKGEGPGRRAYNAKNSTGPAGFSASPIGTDRYNPTIVPSKPIMSDSGDILKDQGISQERKEIKVLRTAFRVLKGDPSFRAQIDKILAAYHKKRQSIKGATDAIGKEAGEKDPETVISHYPRMMDKAYGKMSDLIEAGRQQGETPAMRKKIEEYRDEYENLKAIYDDAMDSVAEVIGDNEANSNRYQEALVDIIKHTAQDILEHGIEPDKLASVLARRGNPITPEEMKKLDDVATDDDIKIEVLLALMSDGEDNPINKYFELIKQRYQNIKESEYAYKNLLKQSSLYKVVDWYYNKLPTSNFTLFYNATPDDAPLTRQKAEKGPKSIGPIDEYLNSINTPEKWEQNKYDIVSHLNRMQMDEFKKKAVTDILEGPYVRRGATATQRLKGLLNGAQLRAESVLDTKNNRSIYDQVVLEYLSVFESEIID